jgi:hypothetical protein
VIDSRTSRQALLAAGSLLVLQAFNTASAAPSAAVALRAGTPGYGVELGLGFSDRFAARVGYSMLDYEHEITDTDVTYEGKLKISNLSALLDWYAFKGGFHLTAGVTGGGGFKVDATGKPAGGGTYEINGRTYSSDEIGSISGRFKFGNSLAPYVGLGWGNPVDKAGRLTFMFDVGAIYGGTPSLSLSAQCGSAAPEGSALCTQVQTDLEGEKQDLLDSVDGVKWYPVLNLGLAYRF